MKIQKVMPDFSSWPISPSLKTLLRNDEKWLDYFSMDPDTLVIILNTLSKQIKNVDFFASPVDTDQFFEFLIKLVESKPKNDQVLKKFSEVTVDILDKISMQTQLDTAQVQVAIHYLNLLSLMLEPDYRYLFNNPEISIWTNDFQKISRVPFNSPELLSWFRHALLLSFQSNACIKKYPVLLQTIAELALSVEKNHGESNELAAMKLFDTLGVLDHTLKTSRVRRIDVNRSAIKLSIQATRNLLYDQFQPFVERNFLHYIVYKSFLSQSYKDSAIHLTQWCESSDYRAHCKSDYLRFKDSYNCSPGQFSDFSIVIQNNNLSTVALDKACKAMRDAEFFFASGMKDFGFIPRYNASHYLFHLAASKNDFLIDQFLYERNDPPVKSYTVQASYFQNDAIATDFLLGKTYSYTMDAVVVVHEYIHHLYALFVSDLAFDLTTTEGIAELFSGGVCSARNIHDLRNFVNDTSIFEFFRHRKYPFYFNALKWVAYLINEQASVFETLVHLLQGEGKEAFYATIDSFIGNSSNIQAFVDWSNQQVNTCNAYLRIFPKAHHQPAIIYLDSIKQLLNYSKNTIPPQPERILRHIAKSDLILSHSKPDLIGTDLVAYSKKNKSNSDTLQRVPLPMSALMAGFLSANFDHMGEIYQEKYPSLPAYIHYGFKPFVFALFSAGLNTILFDESAEIEEKFARLFTYFIMNFCGVVIGQPVMQNIAENIQNKVLCFLVQSLTWTLLWNPSLFMTESSQLIPVMRLQLLQGLFFKVGDETYKLIKKTYHSSSSFWHNKEERSTSEEPILNNGQVKQIAKIAFGQHP